MESPLPASDALIRTLFEALNVIYIPAGLILCRLPVIEVLDTLKQYRCRPKSPRIQAAL